MIEARKNLEAALFTGLIDKRIHSLESLQPNLVLNDKAEPSCVLDTLNSEFSLCDEFEISVAFVTKSGVAVIMAALLEARCRGVTGRLLVSEYLMFTQPEALRALQQFENIEVRVATSGNMHGKGYSFYRNGTRTILIGSSNLTASALKANNELNLKVIASENGKLSERVSSQFLSDFEEGVVADDQYIHDYEERYLKRKVAESKVASLVEDHEEKTVSPNSMQVNALNSISALREAGQKKALLISATGTGKTYLSAFDVQAVEARRVLFVVHRKNIAIAALETYRSIFGEGRTYGLYSGSQREIESDFVFSTVQTISRREHYEKIPRDYFDYVVIDETHRSGAKSYQALIEYLKPQFLLGMTATPERTDGHDVFSDFDHNIAYEIRLHQAMEEKILSPFHYFGVTDITVNGQTIDELSSFNALVSEERGDHILKQISAYGCDDGVVRGLIFCSRTEECRGLSHLLNSKGLKTIALTGDDSEEVREEAINRLESDDESLRIDYIITVDIFNEGIDIPRVNQIVMLRPTSSAIVFVQQLGRGLRLAKGKDYLTVIDFIGNYQNNYLVPIALYGDTSYNKDTIRRLLSTGSNTLPGSSTVNFDQISKKRIFEAIDQTKLDKMKDLKRDYELLKFELGRQPMMMDFVDHGGRDPFAFVNQS
ncbi:DEAD/DEAH box helicase family protein, partial [Marinobacter alexandrii]|uniref:DEAD/DEAH box helicase family protein n=1 Tax=Marinobacter alexandrii TaxID=2570351 RepID=UPI003299DD0C